MCLRCFYVIFVGRMCLRCSWFFHERICLRCFMLFFSSECVYAVYGTFTSEYVYAVLCYFFSSECVCAVFTLFMVPSRANMSSLFMLFFSSECVYAVYGTFTSEYVYYVIFSHAEVFTLVKCSFLLVNMFSLFMAPYNMSNMSCKRKWLRWFMEFFLKLLC